MNRTEALQILSSELQPWRDEPAHNSAMTLASPGGSRRPERAGRGIREIEVLRDDNDRRGDFSGSYAVACLLSAPRQTFANGFIRRQRSSDP